MKEKQKRKEKTRERKKIKYLNKTVGKMSRNSKREDNVTERNK